MAAAGLKAADTDAARCVRNVVCSSCQVTFFFSKISVQEKKASVHPHCTHTTHILRRAHCALQGPGAHRLIHTHTHTHTYTQLLTQKSYDRPNTLGAVAADKEAATF